MRTVVVTGSASGIGAAVVRRLEESGATVVGVDLHDALVTADLSTESGRTEAVARAAERGGGRVDAVVACAGLGPQVAPAGLLVRVNYFGALAVLDGLLPAMVRAASEGYSPAAVAISSNSAGITPANGELLGALADHDEARAAAVADRLDGATVYGMTKLALARAVRRRAKQWGEDGVRLNAVAPGPVETPLLQGGLDDPVLGPLISALPVPLGRRASPEEIAGAVAFLLDPGNGFVHGSILFVDGGSDALLRPDVV
ncbi:MAG TPA: SDR family oxidoreductase [Acidimicrobiales bacterium]|nr:SDR family oxidoreductase [Acidimicrobiales bacterium]